MIILAAMTITVFLSTPVESVQNITLPSTPPLAMYSLPTDIANTSPLCALFLTKVSHTYCSLTVPLDAFLKRLAGPGLVKK